MLFYSNSGPALLTLCNKLSERTGKAIPSKTCQCIKDLSGMGKVLRNCMENMDEIKAESSINTNLRKGLVFSAYAKHGSINR